MTPKTPTLSASSAPVDPSAPSGRCTGNNGNCDHPILAKNLCRAHYYRSRAGKPIDTPLRGYRSVDEQLAPPRVASKVRAAIRVACADRGISEYEFMRRLVEDWYLGGRNSTGDLTAET